MTQNDGNCPQSMPFKVTDCGTSRKPIYEFLLVNNIN